MARPIPEDPPVMMATFPAKRLGVMGWFGIDVCMILLGGSLNAVETFCVVMENLLLRRLAERVGELARCF